MLFLVDIFVWPLDNPTLASWVWGFNMHASMPFLIWSLQNHDKHFLSHCNFVVFCYFTLLLCFSCPCAWYANQKTIRSRESSNVDLPWMYLSHSACALMITVNFFNSYQPFHHCGNNVFIPQWKLKPNNNLIFHSAIYSLRACVTIFPRRWTLTVGHHNKVNAKKFMNMQCKSHEDLGVVDLKWFFFTLLHFYWRILLHFLHCCALHIQFEGNLMKFWIKWRPYIWSEIKN